MAEVQLNNTESTKWMTSYLPKAKPVTDENGEAVPLKDALEIQREQMKAAEEAEKAEAEKSEEEVAEEEKQEQEEREEEGKKESAARDEKKEEATKMDTLTSKDAAPKNEPPAKTPANADKAGEKPTAKTAGHKEPVK